MLAGILFLGIVIPPGAWAVRLARIEATPLVRLSMALGVGIPVALTLLLLELQMGGPWLLLPFVAVALVMSKPGLRHVAEVRTIAPDLVVPALLAGLALWVNAGDLSLDPNAFSARMGFDVSDRAFYALVAQELERAPVTRIENPTFAGLRLQYSYLPSLAAVLLHRYAGVSALQACATYLPAFGMGFTGLAAAALAQSLGARRLWSRALAALLVALGGDLSFLVPHINDSWLERTRHFFVFYSFSSEVQFYNPWAFGVPLAIAAILWAASYCRNGSPGALAAASVTTAALFETKPFAFIAFWLASAALGLTSPLRRAVILTATTLIVVSPAVFLAVASSGARGGAALVFAPFAFIEDAVSANPSLTTLATNVGFPIAALVVLAGGFGLRLLGLRPLFAAARGSANVEARLAAAIVLVGTALAVLSRGQPTRLDGAQFLVLPQVLLWPFAGVAIQAMASRSVARRLGAAAIVAAALASPLRYVCLKQFPERLTASGSVDRLRLSLSPATMSACGWLRAHAGPLDRVVVPVWGDPEDRGGLKPLYVAAVAERRIVAQGVTYHVGTEIARERLADVERLYSTADAGEAEGLLSRMGVSWVWVEAARPLRFDTRRLEPRARFGDTLLMRFLPQ